MVAYLSFLFVTLGFTSMLVKADMAPSYPEPGTIWQEGEEYDITWENDGNEPNMNSTWNDFRIDLMTGDDDNQVFITTIADNLTATDMKYHYKAPTVEPHAPIYFLMFTSATGENAWTTRFAIVGQDKRQDVPENAAQPNGNKIPWGVGKIVDAPIVQSNTTNTTSTTNTTAASVSPLPSANPQANANGSMVAAAATPIPSSNPNNTPSSINIHNSKAESNAVSIKSLYAIPFIMTASFGILFI
ncbi:hypothetical protein BJ944DRAFT_178772 [Cunninghamella echinulata]|nr:hypothetical protein BJ944DRAFT_178772 [Cunninghamella echinulata]